MRNGFRPVLLALCLFSASATVFHGSFAQEDARPRPEHPMGPDTGRGPDAEKRGPDFEEKRTDPRRDEDRNTREIDQTFRDANVDLTRRYNAETHDAARLQAERRAESLKFDYDKFDKQIPERGWSGEKEIRDLMLKPRIGTSVDNRNGANDPASVYGDRDKGYVVVNDKTNEVVQISDKNNPEQWKHDSRITWVDK